MIEIKGDFSGGLNLDDSLYDVPKNSYIDALNVTTDAIEGSNDRAITNIVGNRLVNFPFLQQGENVCIGAIANNVRNTVIYFIWNEFQYHQILEYDNATRTVSIILENLTDTYQDDILGFDRNKKITSINIYNRNEQVEEGGGDLLFFLDSLGRPTVIDIKRFKNGEYTPVTRDIIDVCKKPSLFPPDVLYANDTSKNVNYLRNRLFRFKYRYVYDNNERSVCSPISIVPLPVNILDEDYNAIPSNNNNIRIDLNTGDRDVKAIELLMSYVLKSNDWSDFALIETINKQGIFLKGSYTIENAEPPYTKSVLSFSGVPIEGTVIEVKYTNLITGQDVLVGTYTVQKGDSIYTIVNGLNDDVVSRGIVPFSQIIDALTANPKLEIYYSTLNLYFKSLEITTPANAQVDNLTFAYGFYNDSTYPIIDINESIQLFDYVPDLANAQEMPNGNVLLYGGITEGYDRTLTPNVKNKIETIEGGSLPGGLTATYYNYRQTKFEFIDALTGYQWVNYYRTKIVFEGTPKVGTQILIKGKQIDTTIVTVADYLTLANETQNTVAKNVAGIGTVPPPVTISNSGYVYDVTYSNNEIIITWCRMYPDFLPPSILFHSLEVNAPAFTSEDNSVPTFLFSTQRRIGIAYFDKKGKTNGILYNDVLEFPKYEESSSGLVKVPYINTKVYHTPPIWAHSYGFYLTKEATQFLYWECIKVEKDDDFIYYNISNLKQNQKLYPTTTNVVSYTFQDGDRLRLIKKIDPTPEIYEIEKDAAIVGQVVDPVIGTPTNPPTEGTFIKVKKTTELDITYGDNHYIIQLYRPTQQLPNNENLVYYEFGEQYGIGNPGTSSRYHLGMVSDQGIIPTNALTCNTVINTNPFQPDIDAATLTFSGVPLIGTRIRIYIDVPIIGTVKLADYTALQNDTTKTIVDEIYNQLNNFSGGYLISVTRISDLQISFSYYNTTYTFTAGDVNIEFPAVGDIPAEFNFYGGDVYVRPRKITVNDGQTGNADGYSIYNCLDRNFLDDYISAVHNINGRPSVVELNAKKAYYSTLVRFSQAYQANTNINGLNRFFPANFDEYDYSYGDIVRFKVRDRFVRVFQKLKIGKVPLYAQIVKDPANTQNLIVSDKLLNPISYYVGDLGIGEHAESLVSYNYADYFTSNIKGIIGRISENGIEFISLVHKVDSWATSNLPLRIGDYKIYGGLDQRLGNYIIALEATPTSPAQTLVYDMDLNVFSTFLSYHPEMMVVLGTLFISFKDGKLYTHDSTDYNTFFDNPADDSYITPVFNQNALDKKTFMSVGEVASQVWDVPEAKTDINSYGTTKMTTNLVDNDFVQLEGTYEAALFRDVNSQGGLLEGDSMKGKYMTMKFRAKAPTSLVSLNLLSLKSINSPLNVR